MKIGRIGRIVAAIGLACLPTGSIGCGPPRDPAIVYKKMTPEEFARLTPEEQETPEVQENMGAAWKDPRQAKNATNPRRR